MYLTPFFVTFTSFLHSSVSHQVSQSVIESVSLPFVVVIIVTVLMVDFLVNIT